MSLKKLEELFGISLKDAMEKESTLTSREAQILGLTAKGGGTKQIATDLSIQLKTLFFHRWRIKLKYRVKTKEKVLSAYFLCRVVEIMGEKPNE